MTLDSGMSSIANFHELLVIYVLKFCMKTFYLSLKWKVDIRLF